MFWACERWSKCVLLPEFCHIYYRTPCSSCHLLQDTLYLLSSWRAQGQSKVFTFYSDSSDSNSDWLQQSGKTFTQSLCTSYHHRILSRKKIWRIFLCRQIKSFCSVFVSAVHLKLSTTAMHLHSSFINKQQLKIISLVILHWLHRWDDTKKKLFMFSKLDERELDHGFNGLRK